MKLRATVPLLLAGFWLAMPGHAQAAREKPPATTDDAGDDAETPVVNDSPWGLDFGVQGTRHGAVGLTGALSYDLFPATTLRGTGHATDYQSETTSGALSPPRSLAVEVGVLQRFGHFGLDVAIGHWIVIHSIKADEFNLAGTFERSLSSSTFTGDVRIGFRRSRFSQFDTTVTADFGNGAQTADVASTCNVNNTSFGADGRWQHRVYGAHASFTSYQYRNVLCDFYLSGVGTARSSLNAAQFVALGGAPLSRLQNAALPVIGQQPSLAQSFGQIGVNWRYKDLILAADYLRQKDYFFGTTGTAYFGTLTADLGGGAFVDVTAGRSANNGAPGLFGGLGVRTRF